ncbi:MAG TPA: hypothetical protein VGE07_28050 [Herpetosiphonaceae bacterium]
MYAPNPSIRPAASPLGLFVLLAATVITGLAGGLFLGFMSDIFYLTVLFPTGVGYGIGMALAYLVRRYTIRMPRLAIGCAAAAGLLAIALMHWMGYQSFKREMGEAIAQQAAELGAEPLSADRMREVIDLVLEDEVGMTGMRGYLELSANAGVTIGRGAGFYKVDGRYVQLMRIAEIGLVLYFATKFVRAETGRASCPTCGEWLAGGRLLGSVSERQAPAFLELARGGELRAASAMIRDKSLPIGCLDVYLESCEVCVGRSDGAVRLSANQSGVANGKPTSVEVFAMSLRPDQVRLIEPDAWAQPA